MLVTTLGTVLAEPACVPRTLLELVLWSDVQKHALRVVTISLCAIELAFWHPSHIVLMQVFAVLPLFAKTAKPMLAHNFAMAL